jgi:hypothetical protein
MAPERIPQPHEAVAVVSNDLATRTLTVRLSDLANGYTRLLWQQAWRSLRAAEESRARVSTVWASTPTAYQVAFAVVGDAAFGGQLKFAFRPGEQSYSQLISKPVTATVWIDLSRHRFINCVFKNRQG